MPRGKITEYSVRLSNTGAEFRLELADVEPLASDNRPTLEITRAIMQFFPGGFGMYRSSTDSSLVAGYGTWESYERIYHLLQTEEPVYLSWRDFSGRSGGPQRTAWTVSTDGEVVGEGLGETPGEEAEVGGLVEVLANALARSVLRSSVVDPGRSQLVTQDSEVTRRLSSAIAAVAADSALAGGSSVAPGGTNADRLNADLAGVLARMIERRF